MNEKKKKLFMFNFYSAVFKTELNRRFLALPWEYSRVQTPDTELGPGRLSQEGSWVIQGKTGSSLYIGNI